MEERSRAGSGRCERKRKNEKEGGGKMTGGSSGTHRTQYSSDKSGKKDKRFLKFKNWFKLALNHKN